MPKPSLKLADLLSAYREHADVQAGSRRDTIKTFEDFVAITGAKTLDDLTTETLCRYRDAIKARVSSPATIGAYYGRVKWVIAFGKSEGLDAVQIGATLSRMAVLKAPRDRRVHQPSRSLRAPGKRRGGGDAQPPGRHSTDAAAWPLAG